MRLLWTIVALGLLACGEERGGSEQPPFELPERMGGQDAAAGAEIVEVRMTGDGTSSASFEPAQITISPGTAIRFVNVSGGPHNVAFWRDSVPPGATTLLNTAMPDRVGDLSSKFVTAPNDSIRIEFPAQAPTGVYKGYCAPHLALGMTIDITVR